MTNMKANVMLIGFLVVGASAFADGAKKHKAPTIGTYFYCAPDVKAVKSLTVKKENIEDLGSEEITIVCGNSTAHMCSLSDLVYTKSISIKNGSSFVWGLDESDCGPGCDYKPILFSTNKSDIVNCAK